MPEVLDTLTLVETPEGIALQLRAAGAMPRACSWTIDALFRMAVLWALSTVFVLLGSGGMGLYLILMFALLWLYPVLFEVLNDGQTPGKKLMRLRVINANGTPVTWIASIVRNLMRTVDMLPFGYAFGLVSCLADPRSRRIGDIVAGTLVVHADTSAGPSAAPPVPAVHPPLALTLAERAAIVEFGERAAQLTPERQQELAGLLPMLTHSGGPLAVQRLYGMANALLGRR